MRLEIKENREPGFTDDTFCIKSSMLKFNSVHLFIASHKWDSIHVDIIDEIPAGCLRYVRAMCETPTVSLNHDVTDVTVKLLADLYPEKAGLLRRTFLMHKDVKGVLGECLQ